MRTLLAACVCAALHVSAADTVGTYAPLTEIAETRIPQPQPQYSHAPVAPGSNAPLSWTRVPLTQVAETKLPQEPQQRDGEVLSTSSTNAPLSSTRVPLTQVSETMLPQDPQQYSHAPASHAPVTSVPAPTCRDMTLANGKRWHDVEGVRYSCGWYARGLRCKMFGTRYANGGLTAMQACCVCGGGDRAQVPY